MISELQEVRNAYYANWNTIAYCILLIYLFCHVRIKKNFPSFCVQGIQNFLGARSSNLVGTLAEDNRWYKKLSAKVISFLSKDFWLLLEIYLMAGFIQYNGIYNKSFGKEIGTGANYFALLFINVAIYLLACVILGVHPMKQMDWIAPSYPLALIFSKIACYFGGCCWGIEWENGVYNYRNERYEVPIQLIEAGLALLIFIFMMLYKKKAKKGTLFPIYLIFYSGTRFFSEFLRREENVIGPFKVYHILCVIGVTVGLLLLIVVHVYGDKIDAHFNKNYRGVIGVIIKKVKGIDDNGDYTEEGVVRAGKINQLKETSKKKLEKAKKRRKVRSRKGRIKF